MRKNIIDTYLNKKIEKEVNKLIVMVVLKLLRRLGVEWIWRRVIGYIIIYIWMW